MNVEVPSLLLALTAGLLSFASPCVLPLIPSYLSYIGGVSLDELRNGTAARTPMLVKTALFVTGFSIVFVVLGVLFSGSGMLLAGFGGVINLVAGGIVVLLGLNMVFDLWDFLMIERRFHSSSRPGGYLGSLFIGMAFGAGWTPCIGPILAGILFLAGQSGDTGQGILLLSVYSLGLGMPFLATGVFFPRMAGLLAGLRHRLPAIKTGSGLFLVGIGVLIALGRFQQLNVTLIAAGTGIARWETTNPGAARSIAVILTAAMALLPLLPWMVRRITAGRKRPSTPAIVASATLLLLAVLHGTGVINLTAAISSWLTYQGI